MSSAKGRRRGRGRRRPNIDARRSDVAVRETIVEAGPILPDEPFRSRRADDEKSQAFFRAGPHPSVLPRGRKRSAVSRAARTLVRERNQNDLSRGESSSEGSCCFIRPLLTYPPNANPMYFHRLRLSVAPECPMYDRRDEKGMSGSRHETFRGPSVDRCFLSDRSKTACFFI